MTNKWSGYLLRTFASTDIRRDDVKESDRGVAAQTNPALCRESAIRCMMKSWQTRHAFFNLKLRARRGTGANLPPPWWFV